MARQPDKRQGDEGTPGVLPQGKPQDLHPISDIRFVMVELGKLTERIEGLRDASKNGVGLQIAGLVLVIVMAAFGAWGLNERLNAANARIDRLEDHLSTRLEKLDERMGDIRDRITKLEPRIK